MSSFKLIVWGPLKLTENWKDEHKKDACRTAEQHAWLLRGPFALQFQFDWFQARFHVKVCNLQREWVFICNVTWDLAPEYCPLSSWLLWVWLISTSLKGQSEMRYTEIDINWN